MGDTVINVAGNAEIILGDKGQGTDAQRILEAIDRLGRILMSDVNALQEVLGRLATGIDQHIAAVQTNIQVAVDSLKAAIDQQDDPNPVVTEAVSTLEANLQKIVDSTTSVQAATDTLKDLADPATPNPGDDGWVEPEPVPEPEPLPPTDGGTEVPPTDVPTEPTPVEEVPGDAGPVDGGVPPTDGGTDSGAGGTDSGTGEQPPA